MFAVLEAFGLSLFFVAPFFVGSLSLLTLFTNPLSMTNDVTSIGRAILLPPTVMILGLEFGMRQMSNDIGWFKKYYEDDVGLCVFIHPATKLAKGAFGNDALWVIDLESLDALKENTQKIYESLSGTTFSELSADALQQKLKDNHLLAEDLQKEYLKRAK